MSNHSIARRAKLWRLVLLAVILSGMAAPAAIAAASLTVQIGGNGPPARGTKVSVGETVTIGLMVKNGKVTEQVKLPPVDGLTLNGSGTNPGANSANFYFFVTPTRAGDFIVPAFDIHTADGQTLHVNAITLHAVP
jgi:uncharacterized protein (DUF58 family)